MIHFTLICDRKHEFDGWFRNNADFDRQVERHLVNCPICQSTNIAKTLMAPAVKNAAQDENPLDMAPLNMTLAGKPEGLAQMDEGHHQLLEQLRHLSLKIRENADYVGPQFADEARKIHYGETSPRAIYGEASKNDVVELLEEGVDVLPMPRLPEDEN